MVMVDVKNAFPSVTSEIMDRCLGEVGCPDGIRKWVRGFMGERQISLELGGRVALEKSFTYGTGLPQGSPISPVLFSIVMAQALKKTGIQNILNYVDDCAWIVPYVDVERARVQLAESLDRVKQSVQDYGLSLEETKTEVLFFDNTRRADPEEWWFQDNLGNTVKAKSNGVCRWLGFVLDRRLSWIPHVTQRVEIARGVQARVRGLMKRWGLRQDLAHSPLHCMAASYGGIASPLPSSEWWSPSLQNAVATLRASSRQHRGQQ